MSPREPSPTSPTARELSLGVLAALGVVFGDIGTSPLYAFRECFVHGSLAVTPASVLGVLSLIFWSLILVIAVKYVGFVMRADNRGEGGILALAILALSGRPRLKRSALLLGAGLFGAALLYGDAIITPAISVLGALEGLALGASPLHALVLPVAVAILIGLFLFERLGTRTVGVVFGPVVLIWFGSIGALGLVSVAREPGVLAAANPLHALTLFSASPSAGFLVLGAVFLVVTGGEALYADMGHFGARPVRLAWFGLALPALLANYFGQGALLLRDPGAARNPFYLLAPEWALYPLVGLATVATVVASQAVISGAFSLSRQALQLGYLPRMEVRHSSARHEGQVYLPTVNRFLLVATLAVVLGFRSSSELAGAYGLAVSGTMLLTTVLVGVCARRIWGWRWPAVLGFVAIFGAIDLAFFASNLPKIPQGAWFPLVVAAGVYLVMSTWRRGRSLLENRLRSNRLPAQSLLEDLDRHSVARVRGTAVFMDAQPDGIPRTLVHNLKHNKVLHEQVVLLHVATEEVPHVPAKERLSVEPLGAGITRIIGRYGFMDSPNAPALLRQARDEGLRYEPMETTYFLARDTLVITRRKGFPRWRKRLFGFLSRNAEGATRHFHIPPNRVIEIGAQHEL